MKLGDYANGVIVANSLIYLVVFILNDKGIINAFSEPVTKDGFCVTNKDDPVFNSHRVCFYVDTAFAIFLYVLASVCKPNGATAFIKRSIFGVFGHGVGHYFISLHFNDPAVSDLPLTAYPLQRQALTLVAGMFFWYTLLGSGEYMPRSHVVLQSMFHTAVLFSNYVIPKKLGFTYVQTVLVLTFAFYDIIKKPASTKDKYYDIGTPIVGIPFSIIAWLEGVLCISHVYYDLSIPAAMLVYFLICVVIDSGKGKKKAE